MRNQHNRRQNEIEEKQEQNRKKLISSLSSSDFRSSPKKYFFGLSSANVFLILSSMSAKPKTNYRALGGSAEGTSASFFPYFDEYQNMVADMVRYEFCVQERSARL